MDAFAEQCQVQVDLQNFEPGQHTVTLVVTAHPEDSSDDLTVSKEIEVSGSRVKRSIGLYECGKKPRKYKSVEIAILDGNQGKVSKLSFISCNF